MICRKICLFIMLSFLASCGYSPVYKHKFYNNIVSEMQLIKILPVKGDNGQHGQILRNYLYSKLNSYGTPVNPKYLLEITLNKPIIIEKAYKKDETASFATVDQKANFVLIDYDTKDILVSSDTSVLSSYNVLLQAYATDISKEDTVDKNLQTLSDNIITRLSLFFKERK